MADLASGIAPGIYVIAGRKYLAQPAADGTLRIRPVRRSGTRGREVVAVVTNKMRVTGNGRAHADRLAALAARPVAYLVEAHCDQCGRRLTDPRSVDQRRGPECRAETATPARLTLVEVGA